MTRKAFDVGLVIPLKEEFNYVCEVAPVVETIPYEGTFFYTLQLAGPNVVTCIVGDMGLLPASQATARLLSFANVKLLVLLGLAGSLDGGVRIGDLVVAEETNEYLAKSKAVPSEHGYTILHSGRRTKLAYAIREAVSHFDISGGSLVKQWRIQAKADYESLNAPNKENLCNCPPKIHVGPIASGDIVASAQAFVSELKKLDRKFLAIDMEAAGVARAATDRVRPVPVLVIRGISDFADEAKNKLDEHGAGLWRRYSVRNAISFLKALLDWQGFHNSVDLAQDTPTGESKTANEMVRQVLQQLRHCIGGPWMLGIALGIHFHAPVPCDDGTGKSVEISRLGLIDPEAAHILESAKSLEEALMNCTATAGELGESLSESAIRFRNHTPSTAVELLLREFDEVIIAVLEPDETRQPDELNPALEQIDRMLDEGRIEPAIQALADFDAKDVRVRQRLADVLFAQDRFQDIISLLGPYDEKSLSRREIEHLAASYGREDSYSAAAGLLLSHGDLFRDKAASVFREHILTQFPQIAQYLKEQK